jgi:hypothetical protein
MLQQQIQRKQKSFALQKGLYVLRYESAVDSAQAPVVSVICEPGRNEVILHPEQARATMSAPGQALVIRAVQNGNVQVEIASTGHASTLDATLKFEPLRRDNGGPGGLMSAAPPARDRLAGIQVLGHVARLGDVVASLDQWLGGPSAPSRIEGFSIVWPGKPSDVNLSYAATVAGQQPGAARLVGAGEFTGTRARARPILGLMVELFGAGAKHYQLTVEGLFLGAPTRRSTGQTITLTGPTGREPLVGLRIGLASMQGSAQTQAPFDVSQNPATVGADARRVRVFRA